MEVKEINEEFKHKIGLDIKKDEDDFKLIKNRHHKYPKIKKFKSAYILFFSELRKKFKKAEYENLITKDLNENFLNLYNENKIAKFKNNEMTKKLSDLWKNCNEDDKKYFYEREKIEKEIFENLKSKGIDYKYSKCEKYKKPIRFRTPYMFFIKEHKENMQNLDKFENIEYIRYISNIWVNMTAEEKQKFTILALEDKKRYNKEYDIFMRNIFSINTKKKYEKK